MIYFLDIYCVDKTINTCITFTGATMWPLNYNKPPTSQPITLIVHEMCFLFGHFPPHGLLQGAERKEKVRERKKKAGVWGIYLNNLVVMKAVQSRWGCIAGASWEKSDEQRVQGVKSNCRQIVGLDNGLNRLCTTLLILQLSVCVHITTTYVYMLSLTCYITSMNSIFIPFMLYVKADIKSNEISRVNLCYSCY